MSNVRPPDSWNAIRTTECGRAGAQDHHKGACAQLGIEDYRIHDQRHSYAVRAARAGTPAELIARQLGHANAILVLKVYGRFMPSQQDRDKWELVAAAQDAERAAKAESQSVLYHSPFTTRHPTNRRKKQIAQPQGIARFR
jgi:integrase